MKITRIDAANLIQDHTGRAMAKAYAAVEKALISEALIMCRGNQSEAALVLGISRSTIRKRINEIQGAN